MSFATDDLREEILGEFCKHQNLIDPNYILQTDFPLGWHEFDSERYKQYYIKNKLLNHDLLKMKDRERKRTQRAMVKLNNPELLRNMDKKKRARAKEIKCENQKLAQ